MYVRRHARFVRGAELHIYGEGVVAIVFRDARTGAFEHDIRLAPVPATSLLPVAADDDDDDDADFGTDADADNDVDDDDDDDNEDDDDGNDNDDQDDDSDSLYSAHSPSGSFYSPATSPRGL